MLTRRLEPWRARVRTLKQESRALAGLVRDPRLPWYVRALAALVAAYALSPIDLIPDIVPVLGYLDDLLLVPLGLLLVYRLVPPALLAEHRAAARESAHDSRLSRAGAALVVALWLGLLVVALLWLSHLRS